MTDPREALRIELNERGITSAAAFRTRYSVDARTLTPADALALLHERARYVDGCTRALEALKSRLERGLVVLAEHPSPAAERRWFRLAERSIRLIAKMSLADRQAGADFLDSDLGRWHFELQWPSPSTAAQEAA
jgi:hypothetical protein